MGGYWQLVVESGCLRLVAVVLGWGSGQRLVNLENVDSGGPRGVAALEMEGNLSLCVCRGGGGGEGAIQYTAYYHHICTNTTATQLETEQKPFFSQISKCQLRLQTVLYGPLSQHTFLAYKPALL